MAKRLCGVSPVCARLCAQLPSGRRVLLCVLPSRQRCEAIDGRGVEPPNERDVRAPVDLPQSVLRVAERAGWRVTAFWKASDREKSVLGSARAKPVYACGRRSCHASALAISRPHAALWTNQLRSPAVVILLHAFLPSRDAFLHGQIRRPACSRTCLLAYRVPLVG